MILQIGMSHCSSLWWVISDAHAIQGDESFFDMWFLGGQWQAFEFFHQTLCHDHRMAWLLYWEINSLYRESYWAPSPQPWLDHSMRVLLRNRFLFLFYKADIPAIRKLIFCRLDETFDTGMTNLINTLFMHVMISLVHSESIGEVSQKRMEKKLIMKCF